MTREMKKTNIPWIGEIPSDWSTCRFKNIASFKKDIAKNKSYLYERLALTLNGVIKRSKDDDEGLQPDTFDSYQILNPGDFVFKMIDLQNISTSRVGKSPFLGLVSPAYLRFEPSPFIDSDFYYYYLMNLYYQCVFNKIAGDGVRSALNKDDIGNIECPVPPFEEQIKIVKAIKSKEEKINSLITNEEKQIEKLKAYKQALISEVVTKGLDPNVPMKDSGVDWIGKIPFGWSVIRLKQLFNIYSGSTPRSNESLFYDGDIVWVTPADYKTDDVFVFDSKRKITAAGLKSCNLTIVENGSLIISKRAPIGTVAMAGTNLCTNQGCLSCTPKNMLINTKFYYYVLSVVGRELDILGSGTTFKEISYTNFGNFNIPYPSYRIQNLICAYLDSISNNITSLIEKHTNKISLLRKYRQSMIYEYVTGKRKVY